MGSLGTKENPCSSKGKYDLQAEPNFAQTFPLGINRQKRLRPFNDYNLLRNSSTPKYGEIYSKKPKLNKHPELICRH
jgi:hypothetical protein